MDSKIYSVGIDIGTTTTQIIFSEITLKNVAGPFLMPKVEIVSKKVIYKSEVYFTPIMQGEIIDYEALKLIVEEEFSKSGINKRDISSGAVIITGETSRKENAKKVIDSLAEYAGDFVVSTAGPDLEAVLAGYGAGAAEISRKLNKKVVNFDIGGGTTNACVFNCGKAEDFYALDIGGRLLKFDYSGEISYVSERITSLIESLGLSNFITLKRKPEYEHLKRLTGRLAEMFLELSSFEAMKEDTRKLFIAHEDKKLDVDFVTFSGGVSEYIYSAQEDMSFGEAAKYGDMGPLLGHSIKKAFQSYVSRILPANERIRATVIGAGNFSMKVSGSTIIYDEEVLSIKNIPIVKCSEQNFEILEEMFLAAKKDMELYEKNNIAIAFKGPISPSYMEISSMAQQIVKLYEDVSGPIIVIVENDFAKALGQTIRNKSLNKKPVICLDKIETNYGDYIDIGRPVAGIIPVVVKTLIFES